MTKQKKDRIINFKSSLVPLLITMIFCLGGAIWMLFTERTVGAILCLVFFTMLLLGVNFENTRVYFDYENRKITEKGLFFGLKKEISADDFKELTITNLLGSRYIYILSDKRDQYSSLKKRGISIKIEINESNMQKVRKFFPPKDSNL